MKRKNVLYKGTAMIMAAAMVLLSVHITDMEAKADTEAYHNPVIKSDQSMYAGQDVAYEVVSFGSYPQAEVVTSSVAKKYYGSIDSKVIVDEDGSRRYVNCLSDGAYLLDFYKNDGDLVIDDATYKALSGDGVTWNENGDCVYKGEKYRRVGTDDRKGKEGQSELRVLYGYEKYQWDDRYHYFKYQPIRWRVLSNSDDSYLLLSDKCLDYESCFSKQRSNGEPSFTWKNSNIRSWLNGLSSDENLEAKDFTGTGFLNMAFDEEERDVLEYDETAKDRVLLPSLNDVVGESAAAYGFNTTVEEDEARISRPTLYARMINREAGVSDIDYKWGNRSGWILRDVSKEGALNCFAGVWSSGKVGGVKDTGYSGIGQSSLGGVRPMIRISRENAEHLVYQGVYHSSSEKGEYIITGGKYGNVSGPVRVTADNAQGYLATYDCIYYGEYPQAEVISEKMNKSYADKILRKDSIQEGDLIVNTPLYEALQNATWSMDNTTVINGHKFRRMSSWDADFRNVLTDKEYYEKSYNWETGGTYHYFAYEPIKWIVLEVKDGRALLLADKILDEYRYNFYLEPVTWETSKIREWLNGTFPEDAFSEAQKKKIVDSEVINVDGWKTAVREGGKITGYTWAKGGNDTVDKIFCLSLYDVVHSNMAVRHGFFLGTIDNTRKAKSSVYAKARGCDVSKEGYCDWWLRTPGAGEKAAVTVNTNGNVNIDGIKVNGKWGQRNSKESVYRMDTGVRPAMWLNLKNNTGIIMGGKRYSTGEISGDIKHYDYQDIIKKTNYSEEWVNGLWYNKDGTQTYKYKLSWRSNKKGWWVVDTKGWYPKKQWQKIDGVWYYFKADGYMASNEWCKGYWLNRNGSWTYKAKASWKKDAKGWKYVDTKGWFAKSQWQKIDGKWYYFDAKGYIVTGTKIIGNKTYEFDANGVCLNP